MLESYLQQKNNLKIVKNQKSKVGNPLEWMIYKFITEIIEWTAKFLQCKSLFINFLQKFVDS